MTSFGAARILRVVATCLLAIALCVGTANRASGDDLAVEAELQFQLGAERYDAGDYRGALEHFLASNRLVPNKKVVFNIAATYEQLKKLPEAYGYYLEVYQAEKDPAIRRQREEALRRLRPQVALLTITTDPPGATVYLDRKDLGPRGVTPLTLASHGGTQKVLCELQGSEPAEAVPVTLQVGAERTVHLKLTPILGRVRVEGQPVGAQLRVDREDGPVVGVVPTTLSLPPGKHSLFVSSEGHQTTSLLVDVPVKASTTVHVKLSTITGVLVVNADVREALITIDGKPSGFTPAVLTVPVGRHRVRLSLQGYRSVEHEAVVRQGEQAQVNLQLVPVEEVTGASRVLEAVEDAPASVTIITAQELRAMGYPTIAEAVRGVRGIYLSDDRSYLSMGVRGFSRPGDYGNRVLVLVDGTPMNDNYVGSSYLGFDARVDIDDVETIEILRGPGSVLYGGSAFFGVINLITRGRGRRTHGEVGLSTAEHGVFRSRATAYVRLGEDAGVWTSVAGAKGRGADYYFSEYVANPSDPNAELGADGLPVNGQARGLDGMKAGTLQGRFWYKSLSLHWLYTSREKNIPTAEFGSVFGDSRNRLIDTRGLLEARFEPKVSRALQLFSRAHVNLYNYTDTLIYAAPDGVSSDRFRGRWVGVEQRAQVTPADWLRITIGGEYLRHYQALQRGNTEQGPTLLDDRGEPGRDDPYSVAAAYLLTDWNLSRSFKATAGARLDYYSNLERFEFLPPFSPRLAVIYKPYAGGNIKALLGKAFRAPSVYELHYSGVEQAPAAALQPEQVYSGELEFSHRFSPTVSATVAGYCNYVRDLIQLRATADDRLQYANADYPVLLVGTEYEFRRDWRQGWMLAGSFGLQRARYLDDPSLRQVPNSPTYLGSIKGGLPLLGRSLMLMSRLSLLGARYDRNDRAEDPPQGTTDLGLIWDLVFSGEVERTGLRWAVGAYNLADWKYDTVLSGEFRQRTMVQSGRTVLSSLTMTF